MLRLFTSILAVAFLLSSTVMAFSKFATDYSLLQTSSIGCLIYARNEDSNIRHSKNAGTKFSEPEELGTMIRGLEEWQRRFFGLSVQYAKRPKCREFMTTIPSVLELLNRYSGKREVPYFNRHLKTSLLMAQWSDPAEHSTFGQILDHDGNYNSKSTPRPRILPRNLSMLSSSPPVDHAVLERIEILRLLDNLGFSFPESLRNKNVVDRANSIPTLPENGGNIRKQLPNILGGLEESLKANTRLSNPEHAGSTETTIGNFRCLGSSDFRLFEVGMEWSAIAQHYNLLYDEAGIVRKDVAAELAKSYIYFGFTHEAAQVMGMAGMNPSSVLIFYSLLKILNQETIGDQIALQAFSGCNPSADFWIFLADSKNASKSEIEIDRMVRVYFDLPIHIQTRIGDRFQHGLIDIGANAKASLVSRNSRYSDLSITDNFLLDFQRNTIQEFEKTALQTRETLREIVARLENNPYKSSQDILQLMAVSSSVLRDDATLIGSYLTQYRNSASGNFLHQSYILALAKSGMFANSFEELEIFSPVYGSVDFLANSIFDCLLVNASDFNFLSKTLLYGEKYAAGLESSLRSRVIARMVKLGFHNLAIQVFKPYLDLTTGDDDLQIDTGRKASSKTMLPNIESMPETVRNQIARIFTRIHLERKNFKAASNLAQKYELEHELDIASWSSIINSSTTGLGNDLMTQVSELAAGDQKPAKFYSMDSLLDMANNSEELVQRFEGILQHGDLQE